jgi:hypothetical protein
MYIGTIVNDGEIKDVDRFVVNIVSGKKLNLEASLKVVNHSPTGFCWGYAGSGPAQLALALLLDYFNGDRERALSLYQDFKFKVIARLPMDENFSLDIRQIEAAITEIDVARMRASEGSPSRIKDDPDEMERLIRRDGGGDCPHFVDRKIDPCFICNANEQEEDN